MDNNNNNYTYTTDLLNDIIRLADYHLTDLTDITNTTIFASPNDYHSYVKMLNKFGDEIIPENLPQHIMDRVEEERNKENEEGDNEGYNELYPRDEISLEGYLDDPEVVTSPKLRRYGGIWFKYGDADYFLLETRIFNDEKNKRSDRDINILVLGFNRNGRPTSIKIMNRRYNDTINHIEYSVNFEPKDKGLIIKDSELEIYEI